MNPGSTASKVWIALAILFGLVASLRMFPVTSAGTRCPVLSPPRTSFVQCLCQEKKAAAASRADTINFVAVQVVGRLTDVAVPIFAIAYSPVSIDEGLMDGWDETPTQPPCS